MRRRRGSTRARERLLLAIDAAGFEDAVLGLDGDAAELHTLVDERTRDRPDLIENNRRRREGKRSFNFLGDNVGAVLSLLDRHAIGDNEIWISSRAPQASVDALRTALGDQLRPTPDPA